MVNISHCRSLGRQVMTVTGKNVTGKNTESVAGKTDFRERMLSYNHVEGVLPFDIVSEGSEKTYEYNIEDKYTLEEFFGKKKPDSDRIAAVLNGLLETVGRGREYMLSENDYIIRADTVFLDEEDKIHVPYYPAYQVDLRQQLSELAEYMMKIVDYSDENAVLMVYGFYMRTREKGYTLNDLTESLKPEKRIQDDRADHFDGSRPFQVANTGGNADLQPRSGSSQSSSPGFAGSFQTNDPDGYSGRIQANDPVDHAGRIQPNKPVRYTGRSFGAKKDRASGKAAVMSGSAGSDVSEPIEIRCQEEGYVKPDPIKVFAESPSKLKLTGFLIPLASVLIIFIFIGSGLLVNPDTGHNDVIKTGLVILAVAGVCFEVEKLIWSAYAKKLAGSIQSAQKESEEATVFLYGDDSVGYPFSLVSDDQPAINVSHFPYFVGKDARHCDHVMTTQVGISRYHMKIDREGEDFVVSDLNSTNGTFINGERLAPHLPHKIKRGDELRIGKCIYYCN